MKPIQRNTLFFIVGIFVSLFIIGFIRFAVPIIDYYFVNNLSLSFLVTSLLMMIIYICLAILFKSIFKSVWCCIIAIILGVGVVAACLSFAAYYRRYEYKPMCQYLEQQDSKNEKCSVGYAMQYGSEIFDFGVYGFPGDVSGAIIEDV